MPAPDPWSTEIDRFMAFALASQLLSSEQLTDAFRRFMKRRTRLSRGAPCLSEFCDDLVDHDILTRWQCGMLAKGQYKGFYFDEYKLLAHIVCRESYSAYLADHATTRRRVALLFTPPSLSTTGKVEYRVVEPHEA
jgi:hypothetical protein